jgi:NADH:ubiquinone oxidoreductase subunit E
VVVDDRPTKIGQKACLFLQAKPGTAGIVLDGLANSVADKKNDNLSLSNIAQSSGVEQEKLEKAVKLIQENRDKTALIYDARIITKAEHLQGLKTIAGEHINCMAGHNNTQGACSLGLIDRENPVSMQQIMDNVAGGAVKLLYSVGEPVAAVKSEFTVLQDFLMPQSETGADVILPAAAWSEYDGTFINSEGKVNRVMKAVENSGVKPHWQIFSELAEALGANLVDGQKTQKSLSTPMIADGWKSAPFHHQRLLEQSRGLTEITAESRADKVKADFDKFLKAEDAADKNKEIDDILNSYREKPGSIIPVLQKTQEILGFLPNVVQAYIALGLNVPPSDVYGIVSFYSFFTMVPRGKHVIKVCLGTACYVMGSNKLIKEFQQNLKVDVGETTKDRNFSLETVRCLGACGLAPVVMVNQDTHGKMTVDKVEELLNSYAGDS